LGPGEAPGSAIAVLIGARADTETARAAVQLLLERGADAAFREEGTRRGLLHAAAAKGWTEAGLRLLVEAGASVNLRDRDGNTPLHVLLTPVSDRRSAFWEHRGDLLTHLVAAWVAVGADVGARNNGGETPLDRVFGTAKPQRERAARLALHAGLPWTKRASRRLRALALEPPSALLRQALTAAAETLIAEGQARNLARGLDEELPETGAGGPAPGERKLRL